MPKDINALKRQRFTALEKMRKILNEQEKRTDKKLSDEEKRQFDALESEYRSVTLEIDSETASQDAEIRSIMPGYHAYAGGRRQADLFGVSGNPQRALEFCQATSRGDISEFRSAMEGDGFKGGFAVPTEVSAVFWDKSLEAEIVRPRAINWPMLSNDRVVPAFDSQDTSSSIYGMTGQWRSELAEFDVQDPLMRALKLSCRKLGIFTSASREVMTDSSSFGSQLQTALIKAIGHFLDYAFINGNGVGQPMGARLSPCTIKVSRETAGQISYKDLLNLYTRFLPAGLPNAVWLISQSTLAYILRTEDTGGSILIKDLKNGILGLPAIVTDKVPALGEEGDVGIYDFGSYAVGMRQEIAVESTNAFKWTNDRLDIRAILRVDAQPIYAKPLTTPNGSTISPFVVLDDLETTSE